jgi:prolyl oligopeptidase
MRRILWLWVLIVAARFSAAADPDPYLWLEDIEGEKALAWVKARNAITAQRLTGRSDYAPLYRDALAVLNSASRIPEVQPHGKHLYNFWQDADHPRGLYRRTTLAEFQQPNPKWETVLDVDDLGRREGQPWAFAGAIWRRPDERRCLIRLSSGGGDAAETREFDPETRSFVSGGFSLPTAKSSVAWRETDSLFVATDFGTGSLTESGYPRVLKLWQRGTPLSTAKTLHAADAKSVRVSARRLDSGAGAIDLAREALTFWTSKYLHLVDGQLHELAIPPTANVVDPFRGRLVIWLKEDWTVDGRNFAAGSVVIADPKSLRGTAHNVELIVATAGNVVVKDVDVVTDGILVTALDNVRGRLYRFVPAGGLTNGGWTRQAIPFPDHGAIKVVSTNDDTGDAWVQYESFTTPPTLYHVPAGKTAPQKIKAQQPAFDGTRFEVQQLWATSTDGTKVPYFVVGRKGMRRDSRNRVWMFSYGGFENALTPSYSGSYEDLHGVYGKLWLERGGVFVLANIRGGGEFGPAWHTSVLKEKHYKCFEDFEAVARDLAARKITSPAYLGIEGRSNGGLLVAATMLRHPELYGAVVCGNPLVDMQRYHRLLAGASWVAEYGNPDKPEEWAFIREYSPYQRVRPGMQLPPILFYTSTRDDRVHPGHARKMMARMEAMGYAVDYYENTEGGHHGSVTNEQLATRLARTYAFLWEKLGSP